MESDPEVQQQMIDRAIKKEFGDDEEKPPSFKDQLKELRETAKLLGLGPQEGKKGEG